jgi:hypothetical protein
MQPRQFHFRRRFHAALFLLIFACVTLSFPDQAHADAKDELSGKGGKSVPLQHVIRKERARGPVFIAIPVAYVFGLGNDRSSLYCSPSVRATNSSNAVVDELIIGIEYRELDGKPVGGSVSRYDNIKVQHQDTHYFYQLETSHCKGLQGTMSVMRCVYTTGEDCSNDVRAVDFGAIPLRLKAR